MINIQISYGFFNFFQLRFYFVVVGRGGADPGRRGGRHHQPGAPPRPLHQQSPQIRLQLPPHHAAHHGDNIHTGDLLRDSQVIL